MRELQSVVIGDRRVRLVADQSGRYAVTIEVWTAEGWEDISLNSDRHLGLHAASLCYRLRCGEQEARAIEWDQE
jgi:hypothetical protein